MNMFISFVYIHQDTSQIFSQLNCISGPNKILACNIPDSISCVANVIFDFISCENTHAKIYVYVYYYQVYVTYQIAIISCGLLVVSNFDLILYKSLVKGSINKKNILFVIIKTKYLFQFINLNVNIKRKFSVKGQCSNHIYKIRVLQYIRNIYTSIKPSCFFPQ